METLEGAWRQVCARALPFLANVAIRAVQLSTFRASTASRLFGVVAHDFQLLVAHGYMTEPARPFPPALAHQVITPTRPWITRSIFFAEVVDLLLGSFLHEEIDTFAILVNWNVTSNSIFRYRETAYNTGLPSYLVAWQGLSRSVRASSIGTGACLTAC
jgi:hypothetical protein